MKVISFNANGIRAAAKKGFFDWLKAEQPDFVCIQETKAELSQLQSDPLYFPEGYHCEYVSAEKKGYSGVAVYAKQPPQQSLCLVDYPYADQEGRYLQFDYPNLSVVSLYLPSGTSGEGRQAVKYEFLDWFAEHLMKLKAAGRELIVCGDYNIAHQPIDLKHWKTNQKNSGFLPEERAWLDKLFGPMGFVDAFRLKNPEPDQYTWWSYRTRAWEKNVGWRIDYQVITPGLVPKVEAVSIYRGQQFSDHAPVLVEYQGDCCV